LQELPRQLPQLSPVENHLIEARKGGKTGRSASEFRRKATAIPTQSKPAFSDPLDVHALLTTPSAPLDHAHAGVSGAF
jgi:hypothetical protein